MPLGNQNQAPMTAQRRQNLAALKAMGVTRGANGRFEGDISVVDPDAPIADTPLTPEAPGMTQEGMDMVEPMSPFFRDEPADDGQFEGFEGEQQPEPFGTEPEGSQDQVITPEQSIEDKGPKGHDWEKREKDAKEAQRHLSKQQTRLNALEKALNQRLSSLDEQSQLLAQALSRISEVPAISVDLEGMPEVQAYRRDFPDLMKVIEAHVAPLGAALKRIEALEGYIRESAESTAKTRGTTVLSAIEEVYPDARQIVSSPEFQAWANAQPKAISAQIKDIVERTASHSVEDALWVLDSFKGAGRRGGGNKQPQERRTPGDSMPRGGGSAGTGSPQNPQLTPLSPQEILSYPQMMAMAKTPAQRELLKQRRLLTLTPRR